MAVPQAPSIEHPAWGRGPCETEGEGRRGREGEVSEREGEVREREGVMREREGEVREREGEVMERGGEGEGSISFSILLLPTIISCTKL